jgi:hypothetical protein
MPSAKAKLEREEVECRILQRAWRKYLAEQRRALKGLEGDDFVKAAIDFLLKCSSEQRAPEMISLCNDAPADVFRKIFSNVWPNCDDTWQSQDVLRAQLEKIQPISWYDESHRTFFESLPTIVPVYRGCSRDRVGGISWTTDPGVARRFAHGHRGISVADPVIVKGEID